MEKVENIFDAIKLARKVARKHKNNKMELFQKLVDGADIASKIENEVLTRYPLCKDIILSYEEEKERDRKRDAYRKEIKKNYGKTHIDIFLDLANAEFVADNEKTKELLQLIGYTYFYDELLLNF
mgnify:CR=1 FL=1